MGRIFENLTNVEAPSGDYPSGRIKDDTGSSDGTPVDEAIRGDIQETFNKAARDSGIPLNDLPDNTTNEFQYFEAFRRLFQAPALAQHGVFNERLATEDITITNALGVFISPDATIAYAVDGGGVAEKFTLKDGAAPVSLGSFGSTALGINAGGIYVNTNLNRIYIANPVNSIVRVFNATTGATISGEDIGGSLSTPVDVKIIESTAKAYILEQGTGEVTVWDISTPTSPVAIPGEDFGSGTIGTGNALYVYDDIGYVIDSDVKQWVLSTQVNTPADDIGSNELSAPSGLFVIGRKVYAVDSSAPPNDVFVYDGTEDREFAVLGKENFASGDFTSSRQMFIRNNKAYVCDFSLGKILVYKQNFDNEHI